jgi:hypothetical protein
MIDANIFVAELCADTYHRLARMQCIDLARAITRRGISPEEVAAIVYRFDALRDSDGDEEVVR